MTKWTVFLDLPEIGPGSVPRAALITARSSSQWCVAQLCFYQWCYLCLMSWQLLQGRKGKTQKHTAAETAAKHAAAKHAAGGAGGGKDGKKNRDAAKAKASIAVRPQFCSMDLARRD